MDYVKFVYRPLAARAARIDDPLEAKRRATALGGGFIIVPTPTVASGSVIYARLKIQDNQRRNIIMQARRGS